MHAGKITAAFPLRHGGAAETISKCAGNRIGFKLAEGCIYCKRRFSHQTTAACCWRCLEVNLEQDFAELPYKLLGYTQPRAVIESRKLLSTTVGSKPGKHL